MPCCRPAGITAIPNEAAADDQQEPHDRPEERQPVRVQVPDDLFVVRQQLVRIGHAARMTHVGRRQSALRAATRGQATRPRGSHAPHVPHVAAWRAPPCPAPSRPRAGRPSRPPAPTPSRVEPSGRVTAPPCRPSTTRPGSPAARPERDRVAEGRRPAAVPRARRARRKAEQQRAAVDRRAQRPAASDVPVSGSSSAVVLTLRPDADDDRRARSLSARIPASLRPSTASRSLGHFSEARTPVDLADRLGQRDPGEQRQPAPAGGRARRGAAGRRR